MENKSRHFVIGTAGHIDHGKTALVKNLTGKDTDWLKEEKERGMTIDLGFAFLGDNITIIDVPGHEKFIRNMVAGVSTIDLVLFVIAADDGVMPQTKEHLEILNLLQIKHGIIVLTKVDLAEPDWIALVIDDIKELIQGTFLENAPIIQVSNEKKQGIDQVKDTISEFFNSALERPDKGVFRLPVDRIFTMKGFGTVVAGTVISGELTPDRVVELLPQRQRLRVRGLQIHEKKVDKVRIGDRAAVNLIGIEKEAIQRGSMLAEPGFFHPTKYFDANFYLLKSANRNLKNATRLRIHIGTTEVIGRISIIDKDEIIPGEVGFLQFRLENPVMAAIDDLFVVRSYSPVETIGGGRVLDVKPRRHKRFAENIINKLSLLESGDIQTHIEQFLIEKKFVPQTISDISQYTNLAEKKLSPVITQLVSENRIRSFDDRGSKVYLHKKIYEQAIERLITTVTDFHVKNPTRQGINKTDLKVLMNISIDQVIFNFMLDDLVQQKQINMTDNKIALVSHVPQVSENQQKLLDIITNTYLEQRFTTSSIAELITMVNSSEVEINEAINILIDSKILVKVEGGIYFHTSNIEEARKYLISYFQSNDHITVGECRKLLDSSRKYTVPLLNYFDNIGFTIRQGDIRVLNPDYNSA